MSLKPYVALTSEQIKRGKQYSIFDGLATEAMTTLTGGTLLTAMAIYAGATNVQIGVLAALPSFTNIFQLLAIWLVFRFRNRKLVAICSGVFARLPLILIGLFPFLYSSGTSVALMIFLLSFHYFFGSLAGPGWNSWMKDMIPVSELGTYFSHRGRIIQILSVTLGLSVGLLMDWLKTNHPTFQVYVHAGMFMVGGVFGLLGTFFLSKTPEPTMHVSNKKMIRLLTVPLKDKNFLRLILFQGAWSFSLALAIPFYSVYVLKTIQLPLSYLIGFNLITQLASIISIKFWGKLSDRISNKSVLFICGPIYALTIVCWPMLAHATCKISLFWMLGAIHLLTGLTTSGINLAIGNFGLKLAEKETAVAYIVFRGMAMALLSTIAPLFAGFVASDERSLIFLFFLSGVLSLISLRLLHNVQEEGSWSFTRFVSIIRQRIFARS